MSVEPEQSLMAAFVIVSFVDMSVVMRRSEGKGNKRSLASLTHDDFSIVESDSFIPASLSVRNLPVVVICCFEANCIDDSFAGDSDDLGDNRQGESDDNDKGSDVSTTDISDDANDISIADDDLKNDDGARTDFR